MVNFAVVSCVGNSGNMKGKFIFTILKPGFINGLSKFCLLWYQVVMDFERFQTKNSRMQTFESVGPGVGLLILHDLDLRSNERLSVDFIFPYLYCIKCDQQLEDLEKAHARLGVLCVALCAS